MKRQCWIDVSSFTCYWPINLRGEVLAWLVVGVRVLARAADIRVTAEHAAMRRVEVASPFMGESATGPPTSWDRGEDLVKKT